MTRLYETFCSIVGAAIFLVKIGDRDLKSISVVTSAFNEESCIPELYSQLKKVFELELAYTWKLLIIDNGSSDNTWKIVSDLSCSDKRVLGIRMSRTFSLDAAFTCGLDLTEDDAVVIMCSDLQDPPSVIHQFIRGYESGYDQVVAKITSRKTVPLARRVLSKIFYKFASILTNSQIPEGVSDFRLVNRKCYLAMRSLREQHRFVRGLFAWTGFKTLEVEIERPPRFGGKSHFLGTKLSTVISWSVQNLIANSVRPLLWISGFGLLSSLISLIVVFASSLSWLLFGVPFAGFGTIVGLISLGFSLVFLFLGVISQYIALIFEQVKERPLYVIAETTKGAN
jgi:dolichol-phosphate mannosyltransferase